MPKQKDAKRHRSSAIGLACALLFGAVTACAAPAEAACQLKQLAELPVKMVHNRPLIEGSINGEPVTILADTGAWSNLVWRGTAERLKLPLGGVRGLHLYGVGGESRVQVTSVKELKIGDHIFRNAQMLVSGDGELGGSTAMILGQEFFSQADVELDLAHGAIRLLKPEGCQGSQIVYWSQTYSQAPLEQSSEEDHYVIEVELNGRPTEAHLDTGAAFSVASLGAAASAGVTPSSPGVTPVGSARGLGPNAEQNWAGTFDSIKIGDETVAKTKLLFSDLFHHSKVIELGSHIPTKVQGLPEVLIGADFFLSHRVLVATDQGMVYFTYNGGPVFEAARIAAAPQSTPK